MPSDVFRFAQSLACHVPVLATLADRFRRLVFELKTFPSREFAPEKGHSFSLQTWKSSDSAQSTPSVAVFSSQPSGCQLASVPPVKRCTLMGSVNWKTDPGANEL